MEEFQILHDVISLYQVWNVKNIGVNIREEFQDLT